MTATAEPTGAAANVRALRIGRGVVLGTAGALIALFVTGLMLWGYYRDELLPLWHAPDYWSADQFLAVLTAWGVPAGWFTGYFVLLELLPATTGVVAAYFVLKGALSWFRLYLVLVLVLFGTSSGAVPLVFDALYPQLAGAGAMLQGLAWVTLFPLAYVFPDGRFVPSWSRWLAAAWIGFVPFAIITEAIGWDTGREAAELGVLTLLFGSAAVAAVYRYLRVSGPVERQQTKWVVVAVALRFGYMVSLFATPLGSLRDEVSARGLATYTVVMGVSYVIAALLPAAIAVAIVRHRLFDIDVWINRALVYGVLTAFVIGAYVAIVGGIGLLWPAGGGVALPLLATGLVAVAFSPVRERVQRAVNRLVYGQRDEPYVVVSQLGRQLESALPPDAVLQTMVDTIGPALKLRYAEAALTGANGRRATFGSPPGSPATDLTDFPLRFHGEDLGMLRVAARSGEELTEADLALLQEVTRQAGIAVRAATLNADLRRSRERIVAAREEERRRLHRDLHDGLGPTMASLYQRVDAARGLIGRDPAAAERLLTDAGTQVRSTIGDLRRVVYSLRPPALDELGLVRAIEETCQQLNAHPDELTIDIRAEELPTLPAVVEVAAYRIAVESVTNMARHSGAQHCTVHLVVADGDLRIDVVDDGTGIGEDTPPGVGLVSMRERAEEIGGAITITANGSRGTTVRARLPLLVGEYDRES